MTRPVPAHAVKTEPSDTTDFVRCGQGFGSWILAGGRNAWPATSTAHRDRVLRSWDNLLRRRPADGYGMCHIGDLMAVRIAGKGGAPASARRWASSRPEICACQCLSACLDPFLLCVRLQFLFRRGSFAPLFVGFALDFPSTPVASPERPRHRLDRVRLTTLRLWSRQKGFVGFEAEERLQSMTETAPTWGEPCKHQRREETAASLGEAQMSEHLIAL